MKKIYKVYAQCCRGVKGITEITTTEAEQLIVETVYKMLDNDIIVTDIDWDDDEAIEEAYDEAISKALGYFEKNEFFECGDFIVTIEEEYPTRSGSYGWTTDFE